MKFLYPTPSALVNDLLGVERVFSPGVHAWSDEKGLFLEAEVPGADPAKLDISVKSNELTLKGVRNTQRYGEQPFERSFELPANVQASEIKAKFTNGILTIELPFQPVEEPQKVSISVS